MHRESIRSLLTQPFNLSAATVIEPLQGGEVNSIYKLSDGDRQFAVKWIGDEGFSGINRFHQFVLQEQLASRGIAPKPVWLSDDERVWVEEWVHSENLSHCSRQADVLLLAKVLACVHKQPITARPLQLVERWEHYIQKASLTASHSLVHEASRLVELYQLDKPDDDLLALCHNDLHRDHVIDPHGPVIVDWEYAAMGNRFFDLASCALINKMNQEESNALCMAYAQAAEVDNVWVEQQFAEQTQVVHLTNQLWQAALDATLFDVAQPPALLEPGFIG